MDPRLVQIQEYQKNIFDVQANPEYQRLMMKARGPGDKKRIEPYRNKIASFESKIAAIKAEMETKPELPAPATHRKNPPNRANELALQAIRATKTHNAHLVYSLSSSSTAAHKEIVESNQLEQFYAGQPAPVVSAAPTPSVAVVAPVVKPAAVAPVVDMPVNDAMLDNISLVDDLFDFDDLEPSP